MVWLPSQLFESMNDEQYAECLNQLLGWYYKCESLPTIDLVTECLICWDRPCVCGLVELAVCQPGLNTALMLAACLPLLLLACLLRARWVSCSCVFSCTSRCPISPWEAQRLRGSQVGRLGFIGRPTPFRVSCLMLSRESWSTYDAVLL